MVSIRVSGEVPAEQSTLRDHPIFGRLVAGDAPQGQARSFTSTGSGVVIDAEQGFVVTNFHVIDGAREIKVKLHDGRQYSAAVIGKDAAVDIAVLRIKPERLVSVPVGESLEMRVGDLVFAIGNPHGLESTATMGMVSSVLRSTVSYRNFESYLQHDAPVNSGNSGGALVNQRRGRRRRPRLRSW